MRSSHIGRVSLFTLLVSLARIAGDAVALFTESNAVGAVVPMPMLEPDCVITELPWL